MAGKARVEFARAICHVIARGDRRGAIFQDDKDREVFLHTLEEACRRTAWRVPAFVRMSNHDHFLPETPELNLVAEGIRGQSQNPAHLRPKQYQRQE